MTIEHAIVATAKKRFLISEDAYAIANASGLPFVASVVDGHGFRAQKKDVADFAQFIASELVRSVNLHADTGAVSGAFEEVQRAVEHRFPNVPIGAAAACLFVDDSFALRFAHVGDCRLYRYSPSHFEGTERLSKDHTPEHEMEKKRLEEICRCGDFRIMRHGESIPTYNMAEYRLHFLERFAGFSHDSLAYTRGFGHPSFRPAFTHEPDVRSVPVSSDEPNIFALCSDGGSKTVRHVFRELSRDDTDTTIGVDELSERAKTKLAERRKGPKHDATIIFFKVSP